MSESKPTPWREKPIADPVFLWSDIGYMIKNWADGVSGDIEQAISSAISNSRQAVKAAKEEDNAREVYIGEIISLTDLYFDLHSKSVGQSK